MLHGLHWSSKILHQATSYSKDAEAGLYLVYVAFIQELPDTFSQTDMSCHITHHGPKLPPSLQVVYSKHPLHTMQRYCLLVPGQQLLHVLQCNPHAAGGVAVHGDLQ